MTSLGHLGADGQPCTHHESPALDALLTLALYGSRVTGFNHDIASKLQGLMMALDEIAELIEGRRDPNLGAALDTAQTALREISAMLGTNRALTRSNPRSAIAARELFAASSERAGVTLEGEVPDVRVAATMPAALQGLSLAIDAAAGAGRSGRVLSVASQVDGGRIELAMTCVTPAVRNVSELLAIAAFVLERDAGSLHCTGTHVVVRLPLAA